MSIGPIVTYFLVFVMCYLSGIEMMFAAACGCLVGLFSIPLFYYIEHE